MNDTLTNTHNPVFETLYGLTPDSATHPPPVIYNRRNAMQVRSQDW
jgi:hypothetical protein